jgi:cytochrome c-type biogenesis protein CcmH/NrfG
MEKKAKLARWFLTWTCIVGAIGSYVYWPQIRQGDPALAPLTQPQQHPQPQSEPERPVERAIVEESQDR